MNSNAKVEFTPYTNSGEVVGVRAILHDGGVSAIIVDVPRDYISSEPLEQVFARALAEASRWLKVGPVALRATGGDYVAREFGGSARRCADDNDQIPHTRIDRCEPSQCVDPDAEINLDSGDDCPDARV